MTKEEFYNELESMGVIIDFRFMESDPFLAPKLTMDNKMQIIRFGGQYALYYGINSTQYTLLHDGTVDDWNNEAKKLIKKYDNMEKLIEKI